MPNNYVLLETVTVGAAGAGSVVLANIPQTGYTDIKVDYSLRDTGNGINAQVRFNGDSANNYTTRRLYGNGGSATSDTFATTSILYVNGLNGSTTTASTFGNGSMYIPNYTSSTVKSISIDAVDENNATTAYAFLNAGLWNNTAAISSITFFAGATAFAANSTFSLYGIAAVGTTPTIAPKATGGDIIQTDGTYWYHAFISSGTFTPAVGLTADILAIAGGGGGGNNRGGGGGAGGYVYSASQSLSNATSYTTTVGAGGAGSVGAGGGNGTNSNVTGGLLSLTASVGGGGGGDSTAVGSNGGSGGGGGHSSAKAGGTGTSGQGFAGGAGDAGNYSGAGGGATSAGANGVSTNAKGGTGISTYSSWGSVTGTGQNVSGTYFYAGGGGGAVYTGGATGSGGNGGGGNGGFSSTNATAAIANTGGGGGGGGGTVNFVGGNGGSGIVIIRYPIA